MYLPPWEGVAMQLWLINVIYLRDVRRLFQPLLSEKAFLLAILLFF